MKRIRVKDHTYELQAGRLIVRDGVKFCNLHGCVEPVTGNRLYDPAELDEFALAIVQQLGGSFYGNPPHLSRPRIVYRELASCVDALARCRASREAALSTDASQVSHWQSMMHNHADRIRAICQEFMPSGSGIDCGTTLDFDKSTGGRLVFDTSYHHMNGAGSYDGWTEHAVTVRPSLICDFDISISGRDRNDIKEYLSQCFDAALRTEFIE